MKRGVSKLSSIAVGVAGVLLAMMMLLTMADVVLRYFFNRPIVGAFELTECMLMLLVFFGLAYTQVTRGHVSIGLVVDRLGQRAQAAIGTITSLAAAGLFFLMAWRQVVYAELILSPRLLYRELGLPISPSIFLAALGTMMLCLVLLVDVVSYLTQVLKK